MAVIALWLGHESIETTHIYVEADLAIKERALERIASANSSVRRYKADDTLLAFSPQFNIPDVCARVLVLLTFRSRRGLGEMAK
jgi:endo-beta-N-acetylglucosaminidase D